MRYLVTGAAGFIGTNLSLRLLEKGNEVIGVDSLSRGGSEKNLEELKNKHPRFKFYKREIEDVPALIYQVKPDVIFHFAAQVAVTTSVENPERDFRINAEGTFRVARAANDVSAPVIYTSTNKVFGDNVNKVPVKEEEKRYDFDGELNKKGISEDFPIDAKKHTPYGCSKLVGDIYVREFGGVVNRCSCMYGKHQFGIVDQGWLSYFAKKAISGEEVTIYGDGKQVRDAVHSDDVIDLLEMEADAITGENDLNIRGEVFNVGGGYENTISLLELCDEWKIENVRFDSWRPSDQKVFYCDISKAEKVLGWKPKVKLKEGLKDLYQWTEKNMSV